MRSRFSQDTHSHYLFTPRDLTRWCLGLLRYDFSSTRGDSTPENLLEAWSYEAARLFKDRLVGSNAQEKFDQLIDDTLKTDWSSTALNSIKGNLVSDTINLHRINFIAQSMNIFI